MAKAVIKTVSSPAVLKIPKTLGACADLVKELSEKRLEAQKLTDEWETQEKQVKEHIIQNLSKTKEGGAVGQKYKALITTGYRYNIVDDTKFYDYIKKTGAFDLLQRRTNDKAIDDRVYAQKPKKQKDPKTNEMVEVFPPLPGMERFTFPKLSITKK